jgi:hypothetical protein
MELRRENRIAREETVFIEVLSASPNENNALVVQCATRDISRHGLKVTSNYPITVGVILELLVDFRCDTLKYLLTGEVKWCHQVGSEPTYLCGFELINAEHSDFKLWQELFED